MNINFFDIAMALANPFERVIGRVLSICALLFVVNYLGAQSCPVITSATVTTRLSLGGRLDFNATGVGGSGSCTLKLEIRKDIPNAPFQFLASISNGPGKVLTGFATLSATTYTGGKYVTRFTYSCTGGCSPSISEHSVEIFDNPVILDEFVTNPVCGAGRMDYSAEGYGGSGNCTLKLEIRPKVLNAQFQFLASISNGPSKKLVGFTTLNVLSYPPGIYEVRFSYDCIGDLYPEVAKLIDVQITGQPCPCSQPIPLTTWIGPLSGNWLSSQANWSTGILPTPCQHVYVTNGAEVFLLPGQQGYGHQLTVDLGASLLVDMGSVLDVSPQ